MNLRFLLIIIAAMTFMSVSTAAATEPQVISDPPEAFEPEPQEVSDPPCTFDGSGCMDTQEISDRPSASTKPTPVVGDSTGTTSLHSFMMTASAPSMNFTFRFMKAAPRVSRTVTICVKTTTRGSFCLARSGRHIIYRGRMIPVTITHPSPRVIRVKVKATTLNLKRKMKLTAHAQIQLLAPVCNPACTTDSMPTTATYR